MVALLAGGLLSFGQRRWLCFAVTCEVFRRVCLAGLLYYITSLRSRSDNDKPLHQLGSQGWLGNVLLCLFFIVYTDVLSRVQDRAAPVGT